MQSLFWATDCIGNYNFDSEQEDDSSDYTYSVDIFDDDENGHDEGDDDGIAMRRSEYAYADGVTINNVSDCDAAKAAEALSECICNMSDAMTDDESDDDGLAKMNGYSDNDVGDDHVLDYNATQMQ